MVAERPKATSGTPRNAYLNASATKYHHDLRHTCAAWLVNDGVALPEVRDLLGHASVTMTEKYAHLAPDNVRAAVEKLDRPTSRFCHVLDRDAVEGVS